MEGRIYFGAWDDYGYWADDTNWRLYYFHRRNEWRRQYQERRERLQRSRLYDIVTPSTADQGAQGALGERRFDACSLFSRACGSSGRTIVPAPSVALRSPATLSRRGTLWLLDNDLASVTIDPERLCALRVARPQTEAAPGAQPFVTFATPEATRGCEVSETGTASGVAVAITWTGSGWSQRAIVSLADGAESPDATVSVVRVNGGGHTSTFLANLSGEAMEWVVQGRSVTVDPGAMTQVRQ